VRLGSLEFSSKGWKPWESIATGMSPSTTAPSSKPSRRRAGRLARRQLVDAGGVSGFTKAMRDYAAKLNEKQTGMEEMSKKFREGGGKIYAPVPPAE
jgi:hypothetical protein